MAAPPPYLVTRGTTLEGKLALGRMPLQKFVFKTWSGTLFSRQILFLGQALYLNRNIIVGEDFLPCILPNPKKLKARLPRQPPLNQILNILLATSLHG
jgi:hypothetical protein